MKYTTMICVTFSSVLLCGCTQSSVDIEAEQAALLAAADAYHEAAHREDFGSMVDFYANDGLILPPNAQEEKGLEGARNFFAAVAEIPGFRARFDDVRVGVAASGDMGYTLADIEISFEGPDGELVEEKERDFHLWKKQDGEWKVAIDIWNSEIPLPGVAATSFSTAIGEDAVKADPKHYKVEFENDRVRVIRIKYGPGEKSVMHAHGPNVGILLTENVVRMTLPDGTSEESTTVAGTAQWSDAEEHLPENLSDEPLEVVLVELKE